MRRHASAIFGLIVLIFFIGTNSAHASDLQHSIRSWGVYECKDLGHQGYLNHCSWSGDDRNVNKYLFDASVLSNCSFDVSGQRLTGSCDTIYHPNSKELGYPEALTMWCLIKNGNNQASGGATAHTGAYHTKTAPGGSTALIDTDLTPTTPLLSVNLNAISGLQHQAVVQCFIKFWMDTGLVHPPAQTYSYHVFLPKLLEYQSQWEFVGADALPGHNDTYPGGQTHVTEWYNDEAPDNWPLPSLWPW